MAQNEFDDGDCKYGREQSPGGGSNIPVLAEGQDDLQRREHQPHEDEHEQELEVYDAKGRDSCG